MVNKYDECSLFFKNWVGNVFWYKLIFKIILKVGGVVWVFLMMFSCLWKLVRLVWLVLVVVFWVWVWLLLVLLLSGLKCVCRVSCLNVWCVFCGWCLLVRIFLVMVCRFCNCCVRVRNSLVCIVLFWVVIFILVCFLILGVIGWMLFLSCFVVSICKCVWLCICLMVCMICIVFLLILCCVMVCCRIWIWLCRSCVIICVWSVLCWVIWSSMVGCRCWKSWLCVIVFVFILMVRYIIVGVLVNMVVCVRLLCRVIVLLMMVLWCGSG